MNLTLLIGACIVLITIAVLFLLFYIFSVINRLTRKVDRVIDDYDRNLANKIIEAGVKGSADLANRFVKAIKSFTK